jgi:Flp pilus assembly protein TadG
VAAQNGDARKELSFVRTRVVNFFLQGARVRKSSLAQTDEEETQRARAREGFSMQVFARPPFISPPHLRRGSIAIFVAIAAIVLIGVMGLAIDTGYTLTARAQLQNAADAAALAGAAQLATPGQTDYDKVRAAAVAVAARNFVVGSCPTGVALDPNPTNDPNGDIVVGKWKYDSGTGTYSFDPADPAPDAVQVRARVGASSKNPPLELFFGSLFGQSIGEGGRSALARLSSGDDPFVLVLDADQSGAVSIAGSADLQISTGALRVNSSNACGLELKSNASSLHAQKIKVVGQTCVNGTITGTVSTGASVFADPLSSLPEPSIVGLPAQAAITSAGTYAPGYYPGGIMLTGGTASLLPGVYVIGSDNPGKGISLTGNGAIDGDGVMLFLQNPADLTTSGTGSGLRLTPPTSGTYAGVSIFQARGNTTGSSMYGDGTNDIQGIVYMPSAELDIAGNGSKSFGRLVVDKLTIAGGATHSVTGTGPRALGLRGVSLTQ